MSYAQFSREDTTAVAKTKLAPHKALQRESASFLSSRAPLIVDQVLNSPGKPLDRETRAFFEARFGHDFSQVRIHTDGQASDSAKLVKANAYTVGNHLAFASGFYSPQSLEGKKLLAHELAHAVQQSQTRPLGTESLQISEPGDAWERRADAMAERAVTTGERLTPHSSEPMASNFLGRTCLQRQGDGQPLSPAARELTKDINKAALQAAQKLEEKGQDKLPDQAPVAPQSRRTPETPSPPPARTHVPPENLRPNPRDKGQPQPVEPTVVKPEESPPAASTSSATPKPDAGSSEWQVAPGIAAQTGPAQAGSMLQGAYQGKNWVPGKALDFLKYFHLQLGILNPSLTLQLTHLRALQSPAGSAATPAPPPDTAQLGGTIAPAVLKFSPKGLGVFTVSPQLGVAGAIAGDVFGQIKGPGKSGTHGQALGVINLQLDYSVSERVSFTATGGAQGGLDVGPKGRQGTGNINGSVVATYHF
jgi:Domain of unknown function (DUF4157)